MCGPFHFALGLYCTSLASGSFKYYLVLPCLFKHSWFVDNIYSAPSIYYTKWFNLIGFQKSRLACSTRRQLACKWKTDGAGFSSFRKILESRSFNGRSLPSWVDNARLPWSVKLQDLRSSILLVKPSTIWSDACTFTTIFGPSTISGMWTHPLFVHMICVIVCSCHMKVGFILTIGW